MPVIGDENEFFRRATLRLCGHLEIHQALRGCLQVLEQHMPADAVFLFVLQGADRLLAVAGAASSSCSALQEHIPLDEQAVVALQTMGRSGVRLVNQLDQDPLARAMAPRYAAPDSSLLLLRIALPDERLGCLMLRAAGRFRYSEAHVRLISLLHDPCAIAVANSEMYRQALERETRLRDDNRFWREENQPQGARDFVSADAATQRVLDQVLQLAPLDSPVLLQGEIGVGRTRLATILHQGSPRREGPLIHVAGSGLPDDYWQRELRGHDAGGLPDNHAQRGRVERAHEGTLFVSEVADLPLTAQDILVEVLHQREVSRLGAQTPRAVDVRLVASTRHDLQERVSARQFREPLWNALKAATVRVPPLRERRSDIPALTHHILAQVVRRLHLSETPRLAPAALDHLLVHDFPGNVQELQALVEHALLRSPNGPLCLGPVADEPLSAEADVEDAEPLSFDRMASRHIRSVLHQCGGRIQGPGGAAELLGLHPNTLRNRMRKLGIPFGRQRRGSRRRHP